MPVRIAFLLWGGVLGAISLQVTRTGPGYSFTEGTPAGQAILLVAGWTLTVSAAVTVGRPDRRLVATLLLLAATAWFVAEWANPAAGDVAFTVGTVAYVVTPAFVFHGAVAAAGLGSTRSARAVVALGYLVMLGIVGLVPALAFDPDALGCATCPANLIDIWHDPSHWSRASELGVQAGTVWAAAAVVIVAWWLTRASAVQRRDAGLLVAAAGAYLGLELAHLVRGWHDGLLGSGPTDRALWEYQAAALSALAAAAIANLVRARRAERALTRVVSDLRSDQDIRAQLASLAGDPTLRVAYPSGDGQGHIDAQGRPVDPTSFPGTVTEVRRAGTKLAVVVHRPDLGADRVRQLTAAVHLALDHERLRAHALAQLHDIRRSGVRLVAAGDAERRRLERDLHDGAQQSLVALLLGLRMLNAGGRTASPELLEAERLVESAISQLRDLAHGLHPGLLERAGLATALMALAETRPLTLLELPPGRLRPLVESTLYLLVERTSRDRPASVRVDIGVDAVCVKVNTHGDIAQLDSISDRVAALDGTLTRTQLTDATLVEATLPL